MMRVALQPAFVLHHRSYRESSLLLDVLTQEYGRIALIARGVRSRQSKLRPLLQPFTPVLLSWQGKTELMTLQLVESQDIPIPLKGKNLLSAFYLNELLIRLLQKHDPYPELYTIYRHTLLELATTTMRQKVLRLFEKKLLDVLGYGLRLDQDITSGEPFSPDKFYQFLPEQGFALGETVEHAHSVLVFSGKSLLSLADEQLMDEDALRDAKRLMRLALMPLVGGQALHSRKLFITPSL